MSDILDSENDILDMLESNETAFKPVKEDTVSKSKESGKIDLWTDTDIDGVKVDTNSVHSVDKSFTVLISRTGDDNIPDDIVEKLSELVKALSTKGFIFRYNGDSNDILNNITKLSGTILDVYLPWKKFNTDVTAKLTKPTLQAYKHAAYYHKAFSKLPNSVRAILASQVHVLLGDDLKRKLSFIIAYTPDGCESKADIDFKKTGTASFPITVADEVGIPIFNLKNKDSLNRLIEYIKTI